MVTPKKIQKENRGKNLTAYTKDLMKFKSVSASFTHSNLHQKDSNIIHSDFTFITEFCSSSKHTLFHSFHINHQLQAGIVYKVSFNFLFKHKRKSLVVLGTVEFMPRGRKTVSKF